MKKTILFITFIAYSALNLFGCFDTANAYTFYYNGKKYEIIKEQKTWENAAACAVENGGYLTHINSKEEQDSLAWHVFNQSGIDTTYYDVPDGGEIAYIWIGANDINTEGTWVWDGNNDNNGTGFWSGSYPSGSAVNGKYNNWGKLLDGTIREPDNGLGGQDAGAMALEKWPNHQTYPTYHFGNAGQWNDIKKTNALYYIIEYNAVPDTSGNNTTSLKQVSKLEADIYPNPAHDYIHMGINPKNNTKYFIVNMLGEAVQRGVIQSNKINVSSLTSGTYYLLLHSDNELISEQIVIL